MKQRLAIWCAATLLALSIPWALAAGSGMGVDALADARQYIAANQWDQALESLRKVNDPGSPDWQNLMGYCLRSKKTPDVVTAQKHYDAALRIDPSHRGALAYSGELALMNGNLPMAEQRLAILGKVCNRKCEEFLSLDSAVRRYKADGDKSAGW